MFSESFQALGLYCSCHAAQARRGNFQKTLHFRNKLPPQNVSYMSDILKIVDHIRYFFCQFSFFNYVGLLNRIQSVVCDTAYRTSENMLVCAPTGAGKTNVALLCITQTIKQNIVNGIIKRDAFKIVYVAPMKALAAEMTASFGKRLAPLGIKVRELTGDMQLTKAEIAQTQMLVTTPEKWDVVTRKPGDVSLAQLVRLVGGFL